MVCCSAEAGRVVAGQENGDLVAFIYTSNSIRLSAIPLLDVHGTEQSSPPE